MRTFAAAAARTAGAAGAATLRTIFLGRELAIAVFIKLLQGGGGVGDFIGVDSPIPIRIEGDHDGSHRRALPSAAGSAGSTRAAFAAGRPFRAWGRLLAILSKGHYRRHG